MKDYTNKISKQFQCTWQEAINLPTKLNAEKHLGFDDWYLPGVNELMNAIDRETGKTAPGLEGLRGLFWSSSSYVYNSVFAWYVNFDYGYVGLDNKDNDYDARCVRP